MKNQDFSSPLSEAIRTFYDDFSPATAPAILLSVDNKPAFGNRENVIIIDITGA